MHQATARAHSNIAFIKYWGNQNDALRLPVNSSISMNLASLYTETTVIWDDTLNEDKLIINNKFEEGQAQQRVSAHLDKLRQRLAITAKAHVASTNNFPMGAGIASSASAFAALSLAAVAAANVDLSEQELSILARLGSGSASRSIPSGFVVWHAADTHEASYAESIAAPDYWDLVDVVAIVSDQHKHTTSSAGHPTAKTSDLQNARVEGAADRLATCQQAILDRDFTTFADVVEHDSNLMHAVMMTSKPPLFYWLPTTLTIMEEVRQWREVDKLNVCYTLDAGPNVHCICTRNAAEQVRERLNNLSGIEDIRTSEIGGAATIIESAN